MDETVADLLRLLDLEQIEVNLFRGVSPDEGWQRVYGGQVLGQALVAANRTVEGRLAHSLHAYFLRAGDPGHPILYEVDRSRDGRSFTSRRVVAIQHGRPIFHMSISFQILEEGLSHQFDMPDVPPPDGLLSERDLRLQQADQIPETHRQMFTRQRPIETRPIEPVDLFHPEKKAPVQNVWVKATSELPDDPALHQCILAYASDMTLIDTCLLPHGVSWFDGSLNTASIDHAMWFHQPLKTDEWLLYTQDAPASAGARGFNRGSFFTQDGRLVASVAQEGLIRWHKN